MTRKPRPAAPAEPAPLPYPREGGSYIRQPDGSLVREDAPAPEAMPIEPPETEA